MTAAAADGPGLPLRGRRVVSFEQYVAGPAGTQALADLGADVVKVERPSGDPARAGGQQGMFRAYNRGKRSIALDLTSESDRELARRLVAAADVVVQNLRPGLADRLGLGPDRSLADNPRLVYVSITGYGSGGPSSNRPALDVAVQAESGIMSVTGERDRDPQRVGFTVVDAATGMSVAQAALAGLLDRERTGHGCHVEVSMLNVAMYLQGPGFAVVARTGRDPVRNGNSQPALAPAAELLDVSDGQVIVSAYEQSHFRRLCGAIGRPELADDERFVDNDARVRNRPALLEILGAFVGALTMDAAVRTLADAGVVVGAVRPYGAVLSSPDVLASGVMRPYADESGVPQDAVGPPARSVSWGERVDPRLPAVDEHGAAIRRELGAAS